MIICVYVMEPCFVSDSVVRVFLHAEAGIGNGGGRKGDVVVVFEKVMFTRCGVWVPGTKLGTEGVTERIRKWHYLALWTRCIRMIVNAWHVYICVWGKLIYMPGTACGVRALWWCLFVFVFMTGRLIINIWGRYAEFVCAEYLKLFYLWMRCMSVCKCVYR